MTRQTTAEAFEELDTQLRALGRELLGLAEDIVLPILTALSRWLSRMT